MNSTFNSWYDKKMYATPELAEETAWVNEHFEDFKTIAIVGLSSNPHKDSHYVGRYLQKAGYKIVPVNPGQDEILGEKSYPDLKSIPFDVDVIDVFIKPALIPVIVDQALETSAPIIWLQLGTGEHPEVKEKVEAKGRKLIQSRCIKVDHQFLIRNN